MHPTHGEPAVTVEAGQALTPTVEAQVVDVATTDRRRTPNPADTTSAVEITIAVAASGRKKHIRIGICLTCKLTTIYTIDGCPTVVSLINQVL